MREEERGGGQNCRPCHAMPCHAPTTMRVRNVRVVKKKFPLHEQIQNAGRKMQHDIKMFLGGEAAKGSIDRLREEAQTSICLPSLQVSGCAAQT